MFSFLIHSFPFLFLFSLLFTPLSSTTNPNNKLQYSSPHKHPHAWHKFEKLIHAKKGMQIEGISELKSYFHHFGYYDHHLHTTMNNFTNEFDNQLEDVITRYQKNYNLPITGTLNPNTLSLITSPRCGLPDHLISSLHGTKHYKYFFGRPRWSRKIPITLTYAFSPYNMIQYLSLQDIRSAFQRAFSKWALVVPVTFIETYDYSFADIKIGFFSGDHGDGDAFDGVLGVLAHAFAPEDGRFHLDSAETWAVDFDREKSKTAVDLESVALHEIGHLLGLSHSNIKESVMYPSLKPREKKLNLRFDDIVGVQSLYGSNPNFTIGSLLESETSSSSSVYWKEWSSRLVSFLLIYMIIGFGL